MRVGSFFREGEVTHTSEDYAIPGDIGAYPVVIT